MGIVRGDRRNDAVAAIGSIRQMLESSLIQAAGGLSALDLLEVRLGLATPDVVDGRSQYAVLHVPSGSREGHELSDCTGLGCDNESPADEALLRLAGSLEEGGDGPPPGEGGPDDDAG